MFSSKLSFGTNLLLTQSTLNILLFCLSRICWIFPYAGFHAKYLASYALKPYVNPPLSLIFYLALIYE